MIDHVLTPDECEAARKIATAVVDDVRNSDSREHRRDSSFFNYNMALSKVVNTPVFWEDPKGVANAARNLTLVLNRIRRIMGVLLHIPRVRFEATQFHHRWYSGEYAQNELHSMGFHFDNCLVDLWNPELRLGEKVLDPLIPSSELNVYCRPVLEQTRYRTGTAVLFLVDEHVQLEGGGLYLADDGVRSQYRGMFNSSVHEDLPKYTRVAPACGRVAIFRGDVTNAHAVERMYKGSRWVIHMFTVQGLPFTLPNILLEHLYFVALFLHLFGILHIQMLASLPTIAPATIIFVMFVFFNVYHGYVLLERLLFPSFNPPFFLSSLLPFTSDCSSTATSITSKPSVSSTHLSLPMSAAPLSTTEHLSSLPKTAPSARHKLWQRVRILLAVVISMVLLIQPPVMVIVFPYFVLLVTVVHSAIRCSGRRQPPALSTCFELSVLFLSCFAQLVWKCG